MAFEQTFTGSRGDAGNPWSSEWSLTANAAFTAGGAGQTTSGVYQLFLDCNALAAGDVYTVRVYEKTRSASTQRRVLEHVISGAQTTAPVWVLPSLLLINGWDITLQATGTGAPVQRLIEWSIRRVF